MLSFVIIGFLVATFLQVEGRSININEESNNFQVELDRLTDVCLVELSGDPNSPLRAEHESDVNEVWACIFGKKGIINNHSVSINEDKLEDYIFDMIATGTSADLEKQIRDLAHGMAQQCRYIHGNNKGQITAKLLDCIEIALQAND